MSDTPELARAFELERVKRARCAIDAAEGRARDGAPEGTLVWAERVEHSPGLDGEPVPGPRGNLYAGLVIRPDYPRVEAEQLGPVAVVAAGAAIASLLEPMTGLRYRWPGLLLLNSLPAAAITLRMPARSDPPPWLVIGIMVKVAERPPDPAFPAFNSIHASGSPLVTPAAVLAAWTRQFLSWTGRWAADGFTPVRRAWLQRADGIGETGAIEVGGELLRAELVDLDDDGRLLIREGGRERAIAFAESGLAGAAAAL